MSAPAVPGAATTVVNGDSPQSVTLRHLLTYPAVQDGVRNFSATQIGKMSIRLSSAAYQMVAGPVLSLLEKPYQYVSPYVTRADELGDQTLCKVEEKFPVVKKPSPELLDETKGVIFAPINHVSEIYKSKYESTPGDNSVTCAKAALKTVLTLTSKGLFYAIQGLLHVQQSLESGITAVDAAAGEAPAQAAPENPAQPPNAPAPKGPNA